MMLTASEKPRKWLNPWSRFQQEPQPSKQNLQNLDKDSKKLSFRVNKFLRKFDPEKPTSIHMNGFEYFFYFTPLSQDETRPVTRKKFSYVFEPDLDGTWRILKKEIIKNETSTPQKTCWTKNKQLVKKLDQLYLANILKKIKTSKSWNPIINAANKNTVEQFVNLGTNNIGKATIASLELFINFVGKNKEISDYEKRYQEKLRGKGYFDLLPSALKNKKSRKRCEKIAYEASKELFNENPLNNKSWYNLATQIMWATFGGGLPSNFPKN